MPQLSHYLSLSLLGVFFATGAVSGSVRSPYELRDTTVVDTVPQRIDQVEVHGYTKKQQIEASPFAVQSISLRETYGRSGDVADFLNRASGVRLRNNGNLGSQMEVNLGGLQGKAVRLFKDGIPIELFGHGFNLGMIPVNMLDRVDVYKGAMPVYLAADALGGGVNFVSRQEYRRFAEVSYEVGSFHTHRATAHVLWQDDAQRWYAGTNSSFNYSDNDYRVHVPIQDLQTNATTYEDRRRFHDAARTHYAVAFVGLKNRSWVDDLRMTWIHSSFYKEIQHDAEMNKVYGEPWAKEHTISGLLHYKKRMVKERLQLDVLGAYSAFDTQFVDTATVRYRWDGTTIGQYLSPGEINRGNLQRLDFRLWYTRLLASYQLSDAHHLDISQVYQAQRRIGSDPLGAVSAIENIDVLTVPATYSKHNSAVGLRSSWWGQAVETTFALKYNGFRTHGYTTDNTGLGWLADGQGGQLGYMAGVRWANPQVMAKLSYEYANRLPDEYEIFGDARMIRENLDLQPEKSHNINLNGKYATSTFDVQMGLFFRQVRDIIFLQLDIPFSRYINYEQARGQGVELEANYRPYSWLNIGGNATYQDMRRINIQEPMFRNLEGSRIPNVPFLFGNFWVNMPWSDVFRDSDKLSLQWGSNYTHRFFLYAISRTQEPGLFEQSTNVSTSLLIPRDQRLGQFSHDLSLSYRFSGQRLTLAVSCRNVTNAKLYDNFNVQRPGRSLQAKLVYNFL